MRKVAKAKLRDVHAYGATWQLDIRVGSEGVRSVVYGVDPELGAGLLYVDKNGNEQFVPQSNVVGVQLAPIEAKTEAKEVSK
jgi:hypothetical protein